MYITKAKITLKTLISNQTKYDWEIVIFGVLISIIMFWGLGQSSLQDWDEAGYAQLSKLMAQGRNWLSPLSEEILQNESWSIPPFEYKLYFHKPPLFMWVTAVFFQFFGVNEFWARAASVLSGIGLIIITYLVGKLIYNKYVGILAAMVLFSNLHFMRASRVGMTDMMLTFFMILAIYAFLRLDWNDQKRWYVIWISCALAFMVKSVASFAAPAAIILTILFNRQWKTTLQSRCFWNGFFVALVIVTPWHIYMFSQHGQKFIDMYIVQNLLTRVSSPLDNQTGDSFFYIEIMRTLFFPWAYFAPFALAYSFNENVISLKPSPSRVLLYLILIVFGLYTVAQTKFSWYIIPLYPPLSVIIASTLMRAFQVPTSIAFSGLVISTLVVALLSPVRLVFGFTILTVLLIGLYFKTKKPIYRPMMLLMFVFLVTLGIRSIRPLYRGGETAIAKLSKLAIRTDPEDQDSMIVLFENRDHEPTPRFYSERHIDIALTIENVGDFISDGQTKRIILNNQNMEALSANYDFKVIEEAPPLVYGFITLKQQ